MLGLSQIPSVVILAGMFIAIIIGRVHCFIPALIGAALTVVLVFFIVIKSPSPSSCFESGTARSLLILDSGARAYRVPRCELADHHSLRIWRSRIEG